MTPNQLRFLLGAGLCLVGSLLVGYSMAVGSYVLLVLCGGMVLLTAVLVAEGFAALLAFGLLCPFVMPVPFVHGFPLLASVLALCVVKYIMRRSLRRDSLGRPVMILTVGFAIFFLWVLIRYAMDPVLPNPRGFGTHITGFRTYFKYAISLGLIVSLGVLLNTRAQLTRFLKWLGLISAALALLLIPLVFSRNMMVGSLLSQYGIFVTTFDNGFLRFVVLPGYGTILVALGLLPELLRPTPRMRVALLGLGLVAVVLGGSRSSFLVLLVMVLCVALLRWPWIRTGAFLAGIAALLAVFHLVGEHLQFREVGLLRILSLTSQRIAYQTDAAENVRWRLARWERAMADIETRPWVGTGYGGLENAWVFQTRADFESAMVDVDVAAGSVHNGYLAAARSLGIPAVLFFLLLLAWHAAGNLRQARRLRRRDPFASDLHLFVFAYLVGNSVAIQFGSDLNDPMIWMFFALGVLIRRLHPAPRPGPAPAASPPALALTAARAA